MGLILQSVGAGGGDLLRRRRDLVCMVRSMNLVRLLKIYRRADRFFSLLERGHMDKKLWQSKVFWFNVLTAAAELTQVLPIPPGTLVIVAAVINIGLRLVTDKPVTILPQS